jgi:hypothetical protein
MLILYTGRMHACRAYTCACSVTRSWYVGTMHSAVHMCACMYMCACKFVCIYIYIYIYIHTHTHIYIHAYTYVCIWDLTGNRLYVLCIHKFPRHVYLMCSHNMASVNAHACMHTHKILGKYMLVCSKCVKAGFTLQQILCLPTYLRTTFLHFSVVIIMDASIR